VCPVVPVDPVVHVISVSPVDPLVPVSPVSPVSRVLHVRAALLPLARRHDVPFIVVPVPYAGGEHRPARRLTTEAAVTP